MPEQTDPFSVPIKAWFPDGKFPEGECTLWETVNQAEAKAREENVQQKYEELRQAAEVHRQVTTFEWQTI